MGKGSILRNQKKCEEAIECYEKAIEIDPNNAYSWKNKGLALQHLNRKSEAKAAFDKARKFR